MSEPKWLALSMVIAIHDEALAAFGGAAGVRDSGLLDSALNRSRQHFHYSDEASLFDLAAVLCAGIVKNLPFVDGNKRTGLLSARAFLYLNGIELEPDQAQEVEAMVAVAASEWDEPQLAGWLEVNSSKRTPTGRRR